MLFIFFLNLLNHLSAICILGDAKEVSDSVLFRKANSVVSAELGSAHFARTCQGIMPLKEVFARILAIKIRVFTNEHVYSLLFRHILHVLCGCISVSSVYCSSMCEAVA